MNDDTISRQAAIEAIYKVPDGNWSSKRYVRAIADLPSAQPDLQEYSVWFRIGETLVDVSKMHITAEEGIEKIRSYLVRMKNPERKVGKWIEVKNKWGALEIVCSECRAQVPRDEWGNAMQSAYCYRCGARMSTSNNARWIKQPNGEYKCSVCGDTTLVPLYECHTCGARMEGEEEWK